MCRSFMYARTRHLLYCQDELAQLQQGLLDQDDEDASSEKSKVLMGSRKRWQHRNDEFPRKAILMKMAPKLKEYGKVFLASFQTASAYTASR